jgi:hypothetical protein
MSVLNFLPLTVVYDATGPLPRTLAADIETLTPTEAELQADPS